MTFFSVNLITNGKDEGDPSNDVMFKNGKYCW